MRRAVKGAGVAVMAVVALWVTMLAGCGSSITEKTPQTPAGSATYKNSALLVGTAELAAGIDAANQVVIDVRSTYGTTGHIKNAVNLPPGTFDKGGAGVDATDLKTPAEIAVILGNAGISATTKVIIYGQNVDPNAGRVFWVLEYM